MKALGERSPMMVVTGLDPKPPPTLEYGLPVQSVGVDDYCVELVKYLEDMYQAVRDRGAEYAQAREGTVSNSKMDVLREGDLALRLKPEKTRPHGTTRYDRVEDCI